MTAPATSPPITYSVNGKQYVAIMAGGESHDDPTPGVSAATRSTCSPSRADPDGRKRWPLCAAATAVRLDEAHAEIPDTAHGPRACAVSV